MQLALSELTSQRGRRKEEEKESMSPRQRRAHEKDSKTCRVSAANGSEEVMLKRIIHGIEIQEGKD